MYLIEYNETIGVNAMLRRRFTGLAIALWLLPWVAHSTNTPEVITVFAAASLTDVLQELGADYAKQSGIKVECSFAATSTLARQIESGAHADVFFSADQEWMDYLDQRALIQKATRRNMLGNRLALVAPVTSVLQLQIKPNFPLLAALNGGRLATGDPDSVPVGRYARSALTSLGVWNDVADRLVRADNVRTALAFVARGEVPLGIVYKTDAQIDKQVRIVDLFPADSHLPISYPIALTNTANTKAASLVEFLRGPVGTAAFEKYGFSVLH
ncbi:MAG TPA: molybdate ABC transporter substrate-binding protein [Steroidobacteraceae bacterium]|nr:molybdate ABC transporter substrate-binding protein [Steroidobacteraceae bacterium]